MDDLNINDIKVSNDKRSIIEDPFLDRLEREDKSFITVMDKTKEKYILRSTDRKMKSNYSKLDSHAQITGKSQELQRRSEAGIYN